MQIVYFKLLGSPKAELDNYLHYHYKFLEKILMNDLKFIIISIRIFTISKKRKRSRFLIKRWHLSCHCKHKRVLRPISTNLRNGVIFSQTTPRIVTHEAGIS